jgi:hypothetical protein
MLGSPRSSASLRATGALVPDRLVTSAAMPLTGCRRRCSVPSYRPIDCDNPQQGCCHFVSGGSEYRGRNCSVARRRPRPRQSDLLRGEPSAAFPGHEVLSVFARAGGNVPARRARRRWFRHPRPAFWSHLRFRLRRGKKEWCPRCRYRMWSGNRPRSGPAPRLQSTRVRRSSHHRRQVFLPESLPRLSTSPTDRSRPRAFSRPRHRHPKILAPLASCCGRARGCDAGTARIP